jgi:hypothetical protein
MKRAACGVLLVATVLLLAPMPSQAGGHGWRGHGRHGHGWHGYRSHGSRWYGHGGHSSRIYIGLGSTFWWGSRPGWYRPPPAYVYPAPVYVSPPRVIVAEQPVYVQQEPAAALPPSYWYYCESSGGYYPSVPTCPEPWVQVPPRTE